MPLPHRQRRSKHVSTPGAAFFDTFCANREVIGAYDPLLQLLQ
jgi:hypothetical protein